ncbi:sigma-70 family RNA polymerase sigma factor [Pelagibius litoralis]|uniref:Sigma-70 family RNA polymerase sigma factor n=1 Tax=Pelagibius litoralis TaxID=374515 RepID=A0A967EZ40_9PROT|nr:sigma-70 family RNA polymerase sigma factor [Pelagibius litoralis]NIA70029.1 sigma-70 family RNA polymerase sigma factor [Pelagibius litoralis]
MAEQGVLQEERTLSETPSEEEELVAGLRAGSDAHATRFVRANAGWMRAVAFRLVRDDGLADDCVQEALIKALRNIGKFEGRSKLTTWLHRITVNEALMKLRNRKRLQEDLIDPLLPDFDENACRIEAPWTKRSTAEEILSQAEQREVVLSKIRDLPESYRIVLMLRDIEELDTAEVAEALGISEGNVKVRLHRARAALKKLLEPLLRGDAL